MSDLEEYIVPAIRQKKFKINWDKKKSIKTTKTEKELKFEEIKKRQQRENILKAVKDKEELLKLEGKQFIYPNQQEAANKILEAYKDGAVAACLIAQPGTGKTGTAQAVMIHMATNSNDEEIIYPENIINCTGMSDNDWERQFKTAVLLQFRDNIYHRQNLIRQQDKLRSLNNGLIIPDECHIASGSKMTIAKILKNAGILDITVLEMRNIKILDISATPDAVLHDYKKWGEKCAIVKIKPGPSYKGFETMLEENRIIDAPNLENSEDYCELLEFLDKRYRNTSRKYFPFRILDPVKINILEGICTVLDWDCLNHNSDERIDKIDTLMENPPEKHTIIFIKGFWRASKRISMKHIGATYEPIPKQRDVSVTAQALTARFCDNYEYSEDQLDINLRPLHYCDKGAIEQYVEWFNSDCDFSVAKYKSHRISSNGKGKVKSRETKVSSNIVNGIDGVKEEEDSVDTKSFTTQEEARKYYNEDFGIKSAKCMIIKKEAENKRKVKNIVCNKNNKDEIVSYAISYEDDIEDKHLSLEEFKKYMGRGPRKRKPDENGFYLSTIGKEENKTRVRTESEIMASRKWALDDTHLYTFHPCYEDINDPSTLKWLLSHKKINIE